MPIPLQHKKNDIKKFKNRKLQKNLQKNKTQILKKNITIVLCAEMHDIHVF